MSGLKLVFGSKNLSSWSLRPWLFLRQNGIQFDEREIALDRPQTRAEILRHSPSGRVPVLIDGDVTVWESLAICEYAAERLGLRGWPQDRAMRAMARSISCEMHAGFTALRSELPLDVSRTPRARPMTAQALADIDRIREIWRTARRLGTGRGDWLFGEFGIADAMFAPVALRFSGYAVPLSGPELAYCETLLAAPAMHEWIAGAASAG